MACHPVEEGRRMSGRVCVRLSGCFARLGMEGGRRMSGRVCVLVSKRLLLGHVS